VPNPQNPPDVEYARIQYAFWLAVIGLLIAATLVVVLIVSGNRTAADITAITGLFTSVLGTLVGAFFGLQIGASGRAKDREDRIYAQRLADEALAGLDPHAAQAAMLRANAPSGT
jgi:hypothetical protein